MRTLGDDVCTKPEIVASRLISIRNIYLRQELRTISNHIQEKYKERLPALHLVSIAAYEQVFNRQPLSLPEELRREAIKYGLKYYQLNMEKLRMAEARNGLGQNHDRLSFFGGKYPLHGSNNVELNHNLPAENETTENQSNLSDSQRSVSSKENNSKYNSNESTLTSRTTDNRLESTSADVNSITTSVSSDEQDFSSTSTFSDTVFSSDTISNSPSIDSSSKHTSNGSKRTIKINQLPTSIKKPSRTKSPTIIVHRASDKSLISSNTKDLSIASGKKQQIKVHHSSPNKRSSRRKKTNKYK